VHVCCERATQKHRHRRWCWAACWASDGADVPDVASKQPGSRCGTRQYGTVQVSKPWAQEVGRGARAAWYTRKSRARLPLPGRGAPLDAFVAPQAGNTGCSDRARARFECVAQVCGPRRMVPFKSVRRIQHTRFTTMCNNKVSCIERMAT